MDEEDEEESVLFLLLGVGCKVDKKAREWKRMETWFVFVGWWVRL